MKTAYSILLGEYVDPERVSYSDCKAYQIVCPECYEPVFKVEKELNDKSLHFLSHYGKSAKDGGDCELRVKNYSSVDMEKKSQEGREQRLQLFLGVLKQLVRATVDSEIITEVKQAVKVLSKNKSLDHLKGIFIGNGLSITKELFYKSASDNLASYRRENVPLKTVFSEDKQMSISWDLLNLLYSPKGKRNLEFLFFYAFYNTYITLHLTKDNLEQAGSGFKMGAASELSANELLAHVQHLMSLKPIKAKGYMAVLDKTKASNGESFLNLLVNHIFINIVDILLRMPYFEQMKGLALSRKIH